MVKQQADIVRVVGDYVQLKKAGAQNFSGLCPFHQEKTASFSVHATRQFFHCFGCGKSGDVFTFIQEVEKVSFMEAIKVVAQKFDIKLPKMQYSSEHEAADAKLRGQLIEMHERACAFFQEQLRRPEAAQARQYLSNRGLSEETIREFKIGFAPDSGYVLKDKWKGEYSDELMRTCGLFAWKEGAEGNIYSKFRNRIMFPIANEQGKIIAFTGRTLATDEKAGPKYLNSPETAIYSKSRVLFNLDKAKDAIRKLEYAVIVEGQMDCISVYAAGFKNVIASSGTAFTETQVRLIGRFSKNIVVNFDPDTAGAAATDKSLGMLLEEEFVVKVLRLPAGFDPDLFIRKNGAQAYGQALNGSAKFFDYLVERVMAMFPVRTPEGKKNAVNYLLPHLHHVPNKIEREALANDIAQKLGIGTEVLRQEFKAAATNRATKREDFSFDSLITDGERHMLRLLFRTEDEIAILGYDPQKLILEALAESSFHIGLVTEKFVQAVIDNKGEIDDVLATEMPVSDRHLLMRLISGDLPLYNEFELNDLIAVQANLRLKVQVEVELPKRIQDAFARGDLAEFKRLSELKMKLAQQMRPLADVKLK